ncbi:hypothetical protein PG987_001890 [Apiospora arundinis]
MPLPTSLPRDVDGCPQSTMLFARGGGPDLSDLRGFPSQFAQRSDDCDNEHNPSNTSIYLSSPGQHDHVGHDAHTIIQPLSTQDQLGTTTEDPLIPTNARTCEVYGDGRATWLHLLHTAQELPAARFPPDLNNPAIVLVNVPSLPAELPKARHIQGQAEWQTPELLADDDSRNERISRTFESKFPLGYDAPLTCLLSDQPRIPVSKEYPLLFLSYCYILTATQLQLQKRPVRYTKHFLRTVPPSRTPKTGIVISLPFASRKLIRWLSALLNTGTMGWGSKGPSPAWQLYLTEDADITLVTSHVIDYDPEERPPSADEAFELLGELCGLLGVRARTSP